MVGILSCGWIVERDLVNLVIGRMMTLESLVSKGKVGAARTVRDKMSEEE